MKTKLLFSTLLLGGIMASCSNEEFVKEQTPSTSLPTVNVTVGASFGTDPVTRQAYGDDLSDWNYYWTSSDMLGACLPGTSNNILTNTWFSSDVKDGELVKEAVFTTSAALVTGKYLFYAPYKADMLSGTISTALPEVQVQEGTSRKHLMDNNLFITAMLNIKNDEGAQFVKDAEIDLPLTFKSIYHTLDMQIGIESSTPSAITVEKIVVTPLNSGSSVVQTNNGANLDFSAIESAGSGAGLVEINADAVADPDALQDDVKTALDKIMETNTIEADGTPANNSYTLRLKDGYTYASAEDVCRAFMLIPSCTANKLKVEVYTNEGIYTETINLDGNNGATAKTFNRNGVTSIAKSLKIRHGLDNANVVAQSEFTIATVEDWNDACAYVREHFSQFANNNNWTNPTFTLAKSIEIDSYPTDFKFTLAANSAVNLTVAKDFNLSKTTLSGDNVTFIVKEGTTLTFDEEVANASTNLKITNYGTIVNNIKPTTASPSLNLTFASLVNGDNVKDGKVGTINNNGVIAAAAANALKNNLKGVINNAAGAKITASAADAIVNTGTIDLQGENSELSVGAGNAVKNDGTIKVAAKAKISGSNGVVKNSDGGTIEIADVNNYTIVTTPTDQTVKVEVASLADFKKAYGKTEITNITVTDAITTDAAVTATGKTVTVKGDLTLGNAAFTVKELVVDGDVTVAVKSGVPAATVTGDLTVNAGAKLTVNKEISFNATSSNSAKATILGDMTVNGKAYFFNATVGKDMSPATQVANGSLTVNDVDGAVFGAGDTNGVLNWGTVTQLGKGKIGPKVDNKASTSTFKGNADTSVKATNS